MRKSLLLSLFVGLGATFSQDYIDLVNVYWRSSPANSVEGIADDRFNFNMLSADIKIPVPLNDKHTLIFGSEYQYSNFKSSSLGMSVSSLNLQLGYQFQPNSSFKTLLMFIPKLAAADFRMANSTYFQYAGLILNTKKRSENFAWKFGFYYNGEFFGPMIVPLFGFDWKINERHRLKIVAPVDIEYSYWVGKKKRNRLGFRFIGANASYRVLNNQYLDKADNNAWLFGEVHLTKNIVAHAKAGHSIIRKYRVYDNDRRMGLKLGPINLGDDRGPSEPLFDNGWSFELRFLFRLGLKEVKSNQK